MHGLKIPVHELCDAKQSGIQDVQVEFRSNTQQRHSEALRRTKQSNPGMITKAGENGEIDFILSFFVQ